MAVSLEIPEGMKEAIEEEVERGFYANRSEFIRDAIRRTLDKDNESIEDRLIAKIVSEDRVIQEEDLSKKEKKALKDHQ